MGPLPVPSLIFTVIGTSVASMQARTMLTTRSGSLSSAAPASFLHTLGAGHPKLMSMTSALSCSISTVWTISSVIPPKICGMNGDSLGSLSTFSQEYVFFRVRPDAAVNSVTVRSAPHSLARIRYARSVTPAIGARKRGEADASIVWGVMRLALSPSSSEG